MKAYKFVTKISEKGVIQLPFNPALFDKEVEILIFPKVSQMEKKQKAVDFVNEWAGFLKSSNPDEAKYEYLVEKYK